MGANERRHTDGVNSAKLAVSRLSDDPHDHVIAVCLYEQAYGQEPTERDEWCDIRISRKEAEPSQG